MTNNNSFNSSTLNRCYVYNSSNITGITGNGSSYQIVFNTATYNVGSMPNLSTGLVTITIPGIYIIGGSLGISGINLMNASLVLTAVATNGNHVLFNQNPLNINVGGNLTVNYFTMLPFSGGETLYFSLMSSGNPTPNITINANSNLSVYNIVQT